VPIHPEESTVSEPGKAVFLSYASRDAEAAKQICEALRAAGVEVWFDQNELVGGDAWDAKIRKQIAECALFVPIISASTQARTEGYFRLEWKLAAQRTHMIADDAAFLLPVVIDETRDADARVPAEFKAVQWTRFAGGETPVAFCERVQKLLGAPEVEAGRLRPAMRGEGTPPPGNRSRSWLIPALVALVTLVALALWRPWHTSPAPTNPTPVASAPPPTAQPPLDFAAAKSIAVLAFANLSDDKANEYFSDGISEELLNVLAKVPGLKVPARTSAFYFKGKDTPIPEIAQQLGVAYVVEGSVRKAGDKVRITAQLIKAADGFQVWSDTFTRDLKDIFAVQDEIAGLIAQQLQLKLGDTTRVAQTVNAEAHRLVLEGRHYFALRGEANFDRADEAFRAAVAISPDLAVAYAGRAEVASQRWRYQELAGLAAPGSHLEDVRVHAGRALQLDPGLAEAHAALTSALLDSGRLEEAEAAAARGLAANPNYSSLYLWQSHIHSARGRLDLALSAIQRANELDPLAFVGVYLRAAYWAPANRSAEGLMLADRAAALRGAPFVPLEGERALWRSMLGRHEEAMAIARRNLTDPELLALGWWSMGEALWVLRRGGADAEATSQGEKLLTQLGPDNYLRGYVLCGLGRFEAGLPLLRRLPTIARVRIYYHPLFDPVRETLAFRQMIRELNVVSEYAVARETLARLMQEAKK
jgi:TolB-like protein